MAGLPRPPQNPIVTSLAHALRGSVTGSRDGKIFDVFQSGFFGPLTPIAPDPTMQKEGLRRTQYQPGYNIQYQPRAAEGLTPFTWLINIAEMWDTAAICVTYIIDEMVAMDWSIIPRDIKNPPSDAQLSEARDFLEKPDRRLRFDHWIAQATDETQVTDALSIGVIRSRKGEVLRLDQIDGSTLKPLIDKTGRTPLPPAPAYQQILYGKVESEWTSDELIYVPMRPRIRTLYGRPPTEDIIITINRALRRQTFDLAYYAESNIPEAIVPAPPDMHPDDIVELQSWFDEIVSTERNRRRLHFVPSPSGRMTPFEFKRPILDTAVERFLAQVAMARYRVPPQALGFTEDVGRTAGTMQENVEFRRRIPLLRFFSGVLTDILHMAGWPDCKFQFRGEVPEEDEWRKAQLYDLKLRNGTWCLDDALVAEGKQPIGAKGHYIYMPGGLLPVPLGEHGTAEPAILVPNAANDEQGDVTGETPTDTASDDAKDEPEPAASDAEKVQRELVQWEKYAKRRVGNPSSRPFRFHDTPITLRVQLTEALETATDPSAIHLAVERALQAVGDAA